MDFLSRYAILAFVVACGAGVLIYLGAAWEREGQAADYVEGTEDARDAKRNLPDDDAGLRDWLRDFAE